MSHRIMFVIIYVQDIALVLFLNIGDESYEG